jgi:hypothetical protein
MDPWLAKFPGNFHTRRCSLPLLWLRPLTLNVVDAASNTLRAVEMSQMHSKSTVIEQNEPISTALHTLFSGCFASNFDMPKRVPFAS